MSDSEPEQQPKKRRTTKRKPAPPPDSDSDGEEEVAPKKQEKKKPGKRAAPDRIQVVCSVSAEGKFAIQSKAPRPKKEDVDGEKKKKRGSSSSSTAAAAAPAPVKTVNKFADEFALTGTFVYEKSEIYNKTNLRLVVRHVETGTTGPMDAVEFWKLASQQIKLDDIKWTGTARIQQVGSKIGLTFEQPAATSSKKQAEKKDQPPAPQATPLVPPPVAPTASSSSSSSSATTATPAVSPFGF